MSRAARVIAAVLLGGCSGLLDLPDDPELPREDERHPHDEPRRRRYDRERTPGTQDATDAAPPAPIAAASDGPELVPLVDAAFEPLDATVPEAASEARPGSATVIATGGRSPPALE